MVIAGTNNTVFIKNSSGLKFKQYNTSEEMKQINKQHTTPVLFEHLKLDRTRDQNQCWNGKSLLRISVCLILNWVAETTLHLHCKIYILRSVRLMKLETFKRNFILVYCFKQKYRYSNSFYSFCWTNLDFIFSRTLSSHYLLYTNLLHIQLLCV